MENKKMLETANQYWLLLATLWYTKIAVENGHL
jgi:hypothetical protein